MAQKPEFLSIPRAGQVIGYSERKIRQLIDQGRLRVYRLDENSHPRVKRADVEALMSNGQAIEQSGSQTAVDFDEVWTRVLTQHGYTPHRRMRVH
jgi:excisionase family DNA binding protein